MKCKHCNGTGYNDKQRGTVMTEFPPCPWCGGSGYVKDKEQTNEEWFCQLSTEEKAKWFCDHITCSDGCRFYGKCFGEQEGRELWQEWLKQPHTNKG